MEKILVIWEEIPERTRLFLVELDKDDATRVKRCHGTFINSNDTEDTHWLDEYLFNSDTREWRYPDLNDVVDEADPGLFKPLVVEGPLTVVVTGCFYI